MVERQVLDLLESSPAMPLQVSAAEAELLARACTVAAEQSRNAGHAHKGLSERQTHFQTARVYDELASRMKLFAEADR